MTTEVIPYWLISWYFIWQGHHLKYKYSCFVSYLHVGYLWHLTSYAFKKLINKCAWASILSIISIHLKKRIMNMYKVIPLSHHSKWFWLSSSFRVKVSPSKWILVSKVQGLFLRQRRRKESKRHKRLPAAKGPLE